MGEPANRVWGVAAELACKVPVSTANAQVWAVALRRLGPRS